MFMMRNSRPGRVPLAEDAVNLDDDSELAKVLAASVDDFSPYSRPAPLDEVDIIAARFFQTGGTPGQAAPDHVTTYNNLAADVVVVRELASVCQCLGVTRFLPRRLTSPQ